MGMDTNIRTQTHRHGHRRTRFSATNKEPQKRVRGAVRSLVEEGRGGGGRELTAPWLQVTQKTPTHTGRGRKSVDGRKTP